MDADPVSRLAEAVERLRKQFPGAELLPREVLDILWLAQIIGPAVAAQEPRPADTPEPTPPPATPRPSPQQPSIDWREPRRRRYRRPLQPVLSRYEADMHVATVEQQMEGRKIAALPLRSPGTVALDEALPISRALRPLRRRVVTRSHDVLDEIATAEYAAETRVLQPIYRPIPSGWLDLALVADVSGSMHFWWRMMDELRVLLERHSAFRHLRSWRLSDDDGKLTLRTWSARSQPVKDNELLTAGGRQLIIIVSDCVSPAWSDGRMADLLARWMNNGPFAVFQLLPETLWPRTELRHAAFTAFRGTAPGMLNSRLLPVDEVAPVVNARLLAAEEEAPKRPDPINLPVTSLDQDSLTKWSRMLAGVGGATSGGVLLPRYVEPEMLRARADRLAAMREVSPEERVNRFDQTASEDARDVARFLAAAPFPLTPPIMRVIQRSVLPGSRSSAIAEVLLSGLMLRVRSGVSDDDPESARYIFPDNNVRQRLLDSASASDLVAVLRTSVSEFVGAQIGTTIDFAALLANPASVSDLSISQEEEPFARIGISVLKRLGGGYRKLADDIQRQVDKTPLPGPAPAIGGPQMFSGRRAALQHRLRSIDSSERADGFVRSLYEWGLPVVILAAIAAAQAVTRRLEREADDLALLRAAREALDLTTVAAADQILASIGTDIAADDTPAKHAARATAVAFARRWPPRFEAVEAAAACVRSALERNNGDHAALIAVMIEELQKDIASDDSLVFEALPFRAWILVAGSGGMLLPPEIYHTAAALGRELARQGFRLLSGGWGGVDYMVSLSFAVEVELRGGQVDGRLRHFFKGERPDFDYGSKRWVTGDWIEQALSGSGTDAELRAVVTLGGGDSVDALLRRAEQYSIPTLPLPWTGGASAAAAARHRYLFGRRAMFENHAVTSLEDAEVHVERVARTLGTATNHAVRERWNDYTNLMFSLVRAAAQPPLERRAPRLNEWLGALARDGAVALERPREELLAGIDQIAASFPDWLVDDFVQLTEFERDAFSPDLLEQLAAIARARAEEPTLTLLERRFRVLASPVPKWPMDLLPAAGQAFFGGYDELDRWTKATFGMDAAECFFRASIPFQVFETAEHYMRQAATADAQQHADKVRNLLVDLQYYPRREYVRRFADEEYDAARVIGYVFMLLHPLGIGPLELASRIEAETRETRTDLRPLRQLLYAVSRIIEPFEPSSARITARALVAARQQIAKREGEDEEKLAVQTFAGSVLRQGKLFAAKIENDAINAEAQRFEPGNQPRTPEIPSSLAEMEVSATEIEYLFAKGTPQQRLLALTLAPKTKRRTPFEAVRQALLKPESDAEAMLATLAAFNIAERLTHSQIVLLISLVEGVRPRLDVHRRWRKFIDRVLGFLARLRDSADKVRFAPIAVLGSDPSGGAFRDFVRDLGERLAANDLGVITANATFGVWLWEGYRRHNPDAEQQSFVVLRRGADAGPLSEGLPIRIFEGDLADELLGRAKGAVLIGGGPAAFREYKIARRLNIPVLGIAASGYAAAEVSEATLERLAAQNIAVEQLRESQLSDRLAAAAASALMRAVRASESEATASIHEARQALLLEDDEVIDEIKRRTSERKSKASRRTLGRARILLEMPRVGPTAWLPYLDRVRRYDAAVQRLRIEFADDVYVAELASRCTFAYALIELSTAEELREAAAEAAAYERLSVAPADVVQKLTKALDANELPEGRLRDAAARLRSEIAARAAALSGESP